MDRMNATIQEATFDLDPILRQHAGVYTCFVELFDQSRTSTVPPRSFNLVVYSKLYKI